MLRARTSASRVLTLGHAWAPMRTYSDFQVNMPTSTAPHGVPRGTVNKAIAQGLPPYAAWLERLDAKHRYDVSGVDPYGFLPKEPGQLDKMWGNERIRIRTHATKDHSRIYKRLKYPWMKTGLWYSETLRHWVQVPHVKSLGYEIEKEGGFDNFILRRPAHVLNSRYAERIRRHLLVRTKEIEKNALLKSHAMKLADLVVAELQAATTAEQLHAVCDKYGFAPSLLKAVVEQRRIPASKAVKYVEKQYA